MKFAEWVSASRLSYAEVARRLDLIEGTTVLRYARGQRLPTPAIMRRIFVLTAGRVAPNDFYDLPEIQLEFPIANEAARAA